MLIPVQDSHTSPLILGVFGCLKLILPHVNKTEKNQAMQGSFGTRHETNEIAFSIDRLLQTYELCVHYIIHSDHNVTNASLETLNVLLQNCPAHLKAILLNPNGINKSRISYFESGGKYKLRSPSVLSVATTLMSGDDNLDTELTDSVQSDIEKWISESKLTVGNVTYAGKEREGQSDLAHVPLRKESSADSPVGAVCVESRSVLENFDKLVLSETSSEKSEPPSPADNRVIFLHTHTTTTIFLSFFIVGHRRG